MAPIKYENDFKHTDWIDNVTRVKAGGEDGFNDHFHRIEDEFKKLSGVVADIKDAIDLVATKPLAKPVTLVLTPVLATTGPAGWEHVAGSARKPTGVASAAGTMSVDLPDGVTVQSLRAIGENGGTGVLVVQLRRQKFDPAAASEPIIGVTGSGGVFDSKNSPQDASRALVDTDLFRYFITASVTGAAGTDVVRLDGFQIIHIVQP